MFSSLIMKELLFTLFCLISVQVQAASPLEEAFREALYTEEVDGDSEAALKSYRQLSEQFQKQRTLAARTLFRQAECLRKLDRQDEAITTYQTLLARYPENEKLVTLTKENLLALGHQPNSLQTPTTPAPLNPEDQKIAELKKLLAQSPDLLNTGPLNTAAQNSQLKVATFLLDAGADISRDGSGITPLQSAALNGHLAMCKLLIERGASLEKEGPVALGYALEEGHQSITQYLLSLGLIPNSSHLSKAIISSGGFRTLSQLIDALPESQKATVINPPGGSPLRSTLDAPTPKYIPLLKTLLEHGANPNQKLGDDKLSPLALLLSKLKYHEDQESILTMIELLLTKGADPYLKTGEKKRSPLSLAFERLASPEQAESADQIIQIFLEAGADWSKADPNLLTRAIELKSQKWFDNMIEANVLNTFPAEAQEKAIAKAVQTANPAVLKTLIEHGLQLEKHATYKVIQQLFFRYRDKKRTNDAGKTVNSPYRIFTLPDNVSDLFLCLDLILATKPNLNLSPDGHSSPLRLLIMEGFEYHPEEALQTLHKLLAAGADPNFQDSSSSDSSPFSCVLGVIRGSTYTDGSISPEAIKALLEAGADPKLVQPLRLGSFLNSEEKLRPGATESFPLLWHALNFNPKHNPHRPNGIWLSLGLSAIQHKQGPTFHCLFSPESAVSSVTLKDFVHSANLSPDRYLDLSGDQPLLIHRLEQTEPISILFLDHLASGEDFPLQWGDIVEVPTRPKDSILPDNKVTTFLQTPRPMDLTLTLGDGQVLTNADNATGPIFRYQPKSIQDTTERVRIAAGIAPYFLAAPQIRRPDPKTGELRVISDSRTHPSRAHPRAHPGVRPGDHIHFSVKGAKAGPVVQSQGTGKICQNLDGPFWFLPSPAPLGSLEWLPFKGFASYLLALTQPHGLPLQPIDWQQAHVYVSLDGDFASDDDKGKLHSLQDFFASPPQNKAFSYIIVLPPAKEHTPFPEDLKTILTETLSTPWSLKIGMGEPIKQNWAPRFPTFTQKEGTIIWQTPLPEEQTAPALPLISDLVTAHPQVRFHDFSYTSFPSRKLIRIKKKENTPPRFRNQQGRRRVPIPQQN